MSRILDDSISLSISFRMTANDRYGCPECRNCMEQISADPKQTCVTKV